MDQAVNDPIITVLMSVYNGERWLNECICSILNQTFQYFQFLIVNDESTDGSLEVIDRYAKKDRRIKVIDKPNTGLADSLNQGIKQVKSPWIARIDAADLCEPERFEKQYSLAQSDPSIVLIGTGLQEIDENGRLRKIYRYPKSHRILLRRLTSFGPFFAHSSAFYRTDTVRYVGGYRPRIRRAQDKDLWLRFSQIGRMTCVDLPLVRIRHHENQVTHEEGGKRQEIDSRVAIVSYWLRRYGFVDPVGYNCSDTEFQIFREWIICCLEQYHFFDYSAFVRRVKQQARSTNKAHTKMQMLFKAFLMNPVFLLRYVLQRLAGEHLTKRLAANWIDRNIACVD